MKSTIKEQALKLCVLKREEEDEKKIDLSCIMCHCKPDPFLFSIYSMLAPYYIVHTPNVLSW
ncbi:hypothetical protein HAX54_006234, partial [Datura stramonium]|nr:hypothetical protein [Datura stramonium]